MKYRVRIKAKDDYIHVSVLIQDFESKHPELSDYEIEVNHRGKLSIYSLKEDRIMLNSEKNPCLTALEKFLGEQGLMLDWDTVRDFNIVKIPEKKPEIERPQPAPARREPNPDEFDENGDSPYAYGAITSEKLATFIETYGQYLRNGEAELRYNSTRRKWLPRFGYNPDNPPTDEMKIEIRDYVNNTF